MWNKHGKEYLAFPKNGTLQITDWDEYYKIKVTDETGDLMICHDGLKLESLEEAKRIAIVFYEMIKKNTRRSHGLTSNIKRIS